MNLRINKLLILALLLVPFTSNAEVIRYEMQKGETWESVAEQFGVATSSMWDLEYNPNVLFIELPEVVVDTTEVVSTTTTPATQEETPNTELTEKIKLLQQIVVLLTQMLEYAQRN